MHFHNTVCQTVLTLYFIWFWNYSYWNVIICNVLLVINVKNLNDEIQNLMRHSWQFLSFISEMESIKFILSYKRPQLLSYTLEEFTQRASLNWQEWFMEKNKFSKTLFILFGWKRKSNFLGVIKQRLVMKCQNIIQLLKKIKKRISFEEKVFICSKLVIWR